VRQVHTNGRGLAQDGEDRRAGEKFRPQAERVIGGVSGAEHPLVAADAAHTAPHLVCQRLESERFIAGGERAGYSGARTAFRLRGQEEIDRLFESPLQQVRVTRKGNRRRRRGGGT
jgi:hypothetical protein